MTRTQGVQFINNGVGGEVGGKGAGEKKKKNNLCRKKEIHHCHLQHFKARKSDNMKQ